MSNCKRKRQFYMACCEDFLHKRSRPLKFPSNLTFNPLSITSFPFRPIPSTKKSNSKLNDSLESHSAIKILENSMKFNINENHISRKLKGGAWCPVNRTEKKHVILQKSNKQLKIFFSKEICQ